MITQNGFSILFSTLLLTFCAALTEDSSRRGCRGSSEDDAFPSLTGCPAPWELVGKSCLYLNFITNTTWFEGRNVCKGLHKKADLVTFDDANDFAEALKFVRKEATSKEIEMNVWIGGSDRNERSNWQWITRTPMPLKAPFWGSMELSKKFHLLQPWEQNEQHCAVLSYEDDFYIHDFNCNLDGSPFCQYKPHQTNP